MTVLRKNISTTIIPGDPGTPAIPGSPGRPAYCSNQTEVIIYTVPEYVKIEVPESEYGNSLPSPGYDSYIDGSYYTEYTTTSVPVTETTQTCYPAVPPTPGRPGAPPTKAQIIKSLNKGWNSWARTIDTIAKGKFCQMTVAPGVEAAFLGLGLKGMEGKPIHFFTHGILVDITGVWAFESGSKTELLSLSYMGESDIRIIRHEDLSVAYLVKTGTETKIYTSLVAASALALYGYGYLYSGGDQITSAGIVVGAVQYGSA